MHVYSVGILNLVYFFMNENTTALEYLIAWCLIFMLVFSTLFQMEIMTERFVFKKNYTKANKADVESNYLFRVYFIVSPANG